MKKSYKKIKKGSAIVYALIIAAAAGFLILVASAMILLGTITSSQTIDGLQAYYGSESAMEFGYTMRKYLNNAGTPLPYFPAGSDEASRRVSRSELNITTEFGQPETHVIIFQTILDNSTERASRDLTTMTMDFKIYLAPDSIKPDITNDRYKYILMSDGYYGSAQYDLKSFMGEPDDPFLPYILTVLP